MDLIGNQHSIGSFEISGGTLTVNGNLAIAGTSRWTGGTLSGAGKTTILAGGTALGVNPTDTVKLMNRMLDNSGVVTFGGPKSGFSSVTWKLDYSSVNNLHVFNAGGTIETLQIGDTSGGGPEAFNNVGIFNRLDQNSFNSYAPFNNAGIVNIQGGTMLLYRGGTHTGLFNIAPEAELSFRSGTHELTGGANLTGSGAL